MGRYCFVCDGIVDTSEGIFIEEYPVKGEPIVIRAHVLTCSKCGTKLWDNELDNQNLIDAFNVYRDNHDLLWSDEIQDIRLARNLSQDEFDEYLGFPHGTVRRLENGCLQTEEQDKLIKLSDLPRHI